MSELTQKHRVANFLMANQNKEFTVVEVSRDTNITKNVCRKILNNFSSHPDVENYLQRVGKTNFKNIWIASFPSEFDLVSLLPEIISRPKVSAERKKYFDNINVTFLTLLKDSGNNFINPDVMHNIEPKFTKKQYLDEFRRMCLSPVSQFMEINEKEFKMVMGRDIPTPLLINLANKGFIPSKINKKVAK